MATLENPPGNEEKGISVVAARDQEVHGQRRHGEGGLQHVCLPGHQEEMEESGEIRGETLGKQLQLEWWRNQSDLTSQEVEMLRASEKKRKREERPPEPRGIPRRLEAETQRKREEVAPGDAMEDNVDQEVQMPGPLRPSKREIREKENYNAIGGMRNPI